MPTIVIKDYHWRQTMEKIIIYVPLTGKPTNVNLFATDNYMKISFPPFILELFLWANVLEEESKCTLTNTQAIFFLQKADSADWPNLEMENISKDQKRELRNRVLEKAQEVMENRAKCKTEKYQRLQKEAVKAQINLDTDTLNRIESLRDAHRKTAMQDLEEWKVESAVPILQDIPGKLQENRKAYRPPLKWFKDDNNVVRSVKIDNQEILDGKIKEKNVSKLNVMEEVTEESIVEEEAIVRKSKKKLIEKKQVDELIDKDLKEKESLEENLKKETINEKSQEEIKISDAMQTTTLNDSYNLEESCSCSEDSESDYEMISAKAPLVNKMNQKSSRKVHMKKQEPEKDVINRVLQHGHVKTNRIFHEPTKAIPLPRKSGTITVSFTERVFPTPARESSHVQEQEWLAKQAEARRKTGFVVEDLRPEEQDPQWLKDKGDDFFKAGNYLAAISAYTHGIKISDKMTALYVNRSAAHYTLENYYKCIEDCSKVLELMEPKCESNRISRAKCHARRGAALCKLSSPQHGIPELEAALKLDPDNESIKRDLLTAKQYFNIKE